MKAKKNIIDGHAMVVDEMTWQLRNFIRHLCERRTPYISAGSFISESSVF